MLNLTLSEGKFNKIIRFYCIILKNILDFLCSLTKKGYFCREISQKNCFIRNLLTLHGKKMRVSWRIETFSAQYSG